jgi:hypothetical protein
VSVPTWSCSHLEQDGSSEQQDKHISMQSSSFCTYHKRAVCGRKLFLPFYSTRTPAPFHSGVEEDVPCQVRRGTTFCLACRTTPKEKALAKRKIRPNDTSNAEQINGTLIQQEELKRKVRVLKEKARRSAIGSQDGNGVVQGGCQQLA